jgi:hypothetical protein
MIEWDIGCPGAGKTTHALAQAIQRAVVRGVPLIVVDGEGDPRVSIGRRCTRLDELDAELRGGARVATWGGDPSDPQTQQLAGAIERRGSVVLLVDGAHTLLSARSHTADAWVRLQRLHRHAQLDLYWTTHHLGGDVPQVVQACAPVLYVFRTTSPAALAVLQREYGLSSTVVAVLPRGHYLKVETGFPT